MDITFICKMYCKSFFSFFQTDVPVSNVYSKLSVAQIRKTIHLPVLFSECPDYGGHRESAQIWLYSLSCFPHCHSMNKNMNLSQLPEFDLKLLFLVLLFVVLILFILVHHLSQTLPPLPLTLFPSIVGINIQRTWAPCVL